MPSQVSPVHAAGVVSLDLVDVEVAAAVRTTVSNILGMNPGAGTEEPSAAQVRAATHVARQLAADIEDRGAENRGLFAWRVLTANTRLILATIGAHRPWLLAASLSRSMSAALAAGAITLVTSDLWLLSAEYGAVQLTLLSLVSVLAVTLALLLGADLWERPRRHGEREQVMVFTIAMVASVLIGAIVLYLALFLAALGGAILLVDAGVFSQVTGDTAQPSHDVRLAWFVAALASIGSALGAGLEDDDDVRAAQFTRAAATRAV